jgi:hypothetical protein
LILNPFNEFKLIVPFSPLNTVTGYPVPLLSAKSSLSHHPPKKIADRVSPLPFLSSQWIEQVCFALVRPPKTSESGEACDHLPSISRATNIVGLDL